MKFLRNITLKCQVASCIQVFILRLIGKGYHDLIPLCSILFLTDQDPHQPDDFDSLSDELRIQMEKLRAEDTFDSAPTVHTKADVVLAYATYPGKWKVVMDA